MRMSSWASVPCSVCFAPAVSFNGPESRVGLSVERTERRSKSATRTSSSTPPGPSSPCPAIVPPGLSATLSSWSTADEKSLEAKRVSRLASGMRSLSSGPGVPLRAESVPARAYAGLAFPVSFTVSAVPGHSRFSLERSSGPAWASISASGRAANAVTSARPLAGTSATRPSKATSSRSSVPPRPTRALRGYWSWRSANATEADTAPVGRRPASRNAKPSTTQGSSPSASVMRSISARSTRRPSGICGTAGGFPSEGPGAILTSSVFARSSWMPARPPRKDRSSSRTTASRSSTRVFSSWYRIEAASMSRASAPRSPSSLSFPCSASCANAAAQRSPESVQSSHPAATRITPATRTSATRSHFMSEGESYGEMQPPRRDRLAVGEVHPDWSDRRAHARAGAVADLRLEERGVVPGVASVDEHADAPVFADPVRVLAAHHEEAPPREDRIALLHAQAQVVIAAHRGVAARPEEEAARDVVARRGDYPPDLSAQQDVPVPADREEERAARDPAKERACGKPLRRAPDLEHREVASSGRDEVVGPAEGAPVAEVDRIPFLEGAAAYGFLLVVHREDHRARRRLRAPVARCADHRLARAHVLDVGLAIRPEEKAVPVAAPLRRRVEVELEVPIGVVDEKVAAETPLGVEQGLVAVVQPHARAGIGAVADPGLDIVLRGLDHDHPHQRALGADFVAVDVGLHAHEVAALEEEALVDHELVAVEVVAGA